MSGTTFCLLAISNVLVQNIKRMLELSSPYTVNSFAVIYSLYSVDSAPAYRPPGARGKPAVTKVHDYELPSNQKKAVEEAASSAPLSKNQKRKRAKVSKEELRG